MKNRIIFSLAVLLTVFVFTAGAQPQQSQYKSGGRVNYTLTVDEEAMLDSIQHRTFLFFLNEHHPDFGIVKDRTAAWAPASIASTGFGIPSFAVGVERNWITRDQASRITLNILSFFLNSEQSPGEKVTGYNGFFYHFLNNEDGTRRGKTELSTVDTTLLLGGVLFLTGMIIMAYNMFATIAGGKAVNAPVLAPAAAH